MICDTDVLIWISHGNTKITRFVESIDRKYISILTRMELLQGAKTKKHISQVEEFITKFDFQILPLSENIGHRALIYLEEYSLAHGLKANDAIIAATAAENDIPLTSSNVKHFKFIKDLEFHPLHV